MTSGDEGANSINLDDDSVLIDLELPGKTAKDVDLSLEPQAVIIADKRNEVEKAGGGGEDGETTSTQSINREIDESKNSSAPLWSRRLEQSFRINTEKANAMFANGILRIELPKAEATGVKKIVIQ